MGRCYNHLSLTEREEISRAIALASRLGRDRSAVTRAVTALERFGLVRVAEEVQPGHGRMKRVSAAAREIRLEAVIS